MRRPFCFYRSGVEPSQAGEDGWLTHPPRLVPSRTWGERIRKPDKDEMVAMDVMEHAETKWESPIPFALRKHMILRFFFHFQTLNAVTFCNAYQVPCLWLCTMSNMFTLSGKTIVSTLNAKKGILASRHCQKNVVVEPLPHLITAISVPHAWLFWLTKVPGTFQRAIDVLPRKSTWQSGLFYEHDTTIILQSTDKHIDHVDKILKLLDGRAWH